MKPDNKMQMITELKGVMTDVTKKSKELVDYNIKLGTPISYHVPDHLKDEYENTKVMFLTEKDVAKIVSTITKYMTFNK